MNDNARLRRPRLLSEGVVIVVSILLAFSIDALWDQSQLRGEEREALAALHTEFTTNLAQAERVISVYIDGREHMEALVRMSPEEIRSLSQPTVSAMMLATSNNWTFDPVLGTTDALLSAGKLGILRDPALRDALTTFSNQVTDAAEDIAWTTPFAHEMWRAERRHGGPWTDPATEIGHAGPVQAPDFITRASPEDLLSVRADAEFMGAVSRFHLLAGYYVQSLETIRDQIELILDLVGEPT